MGWDTNANNTKERNMLTKHAVDLIRDYLGENKNGYGQSEFESAVEQVLVSFEATKDALQWLYDEVKNRVSTDDDRAHIRDGDVVLGIGSAIRNAQVMLNRHTF